LREAPRSSRGKTPFFALPEATGGPTDITEAWDTFRYIPSSFGKLLAICAHALITYMSFFDQNSALHSLNKIQASHTCIVEFGGSLRLSPTFLDPLEWFANCAGLVRGRFHFLVRTSCDKSKEHSGIPHAHMQI
jgi:hypothetical protein